MIWLCNDRALTRPSLSSLGFVARATRQVGNRIDGGAVKPVPDPAGPNLETAYFAVTVTVMLSW